jgi:tetraacyldisaccharide 4'-kinase
VKIGPIGYREVISGQRRDPLAILLRCALAILEIPYRIAVSIRNRRYDRGRAEVCRCEAAVISIGNLTTGGTGKTPLVRYVARLLRDHDYRVALVSRGYGAVDGADNDEAMELAWALPDVPHLQNPDRVASATIAVEELMSQVILMDDGFQHRRLHRDLDIVVIDATCPFGFEHQLPRGSLRESPRGLRRAGVAMLSRGDAVDAAAREAIRGRVKKIAPEVAWAESAHRPTGLLVWPDGIATIDSLNGQTVVALSAIGNPEAFIRTVEKCGATVAETITLGDHDAYGPRRMTEIRERISKLGDLVTRIVCTHKDLVKIQTDRIGGKEVVALLIELEITAGKEAFDQAILSTAKKSR